MTLSCLIVIATPRAKKKMASRSRNNYGCYSYLTSFNVITRQLMIFIVLAGFLLNRNKSKYCVLPDPCAGVPEVPGAGYARLHWLLARPTNAIRASSLYISRSTSTLQNAPGVRTCRAIVAPYACIHAHAPIVILD